MTAQSEIAYTLDNGLAHIRLSAPSRLNALSAEMMETLVARLGEADRTARAVLLTGEGRSFCAGVDLSQAGAAPHPGLDGGAILESHVNPLILALRNLSVPAVCAVQGAAAGLGMALALSCDLIVLGKSAYFLAPFARIGLVADGGLAALLVSAVGRVRATNILFSAEKIAAQQAFDWGLVSQVVDDDQLADRAAVLAVSLAQGPTIALSGTKSLIWRAVEFDFVRSLEMERALQRTIPATLDCQEGNRAFLERRSPRFIGR